MKTFRIEKQGTFSFIEAEMPKVSENEVLIEIKRLGFCGSDLNTWRGLNAMVTYPRIIGHELSGVIKETGSKVPAHFKKGLNVTALPYTSCGVCSSCKKGHVNACKDNQTLGVQRDGAFREYLVLPWEKVIVSEKLSLDELVLVEPMSVGFHAVKRAEVAAGEFVGVFGCGMIGLGAITAAVARGANVIAFDIADNKLEKAKRLGASYTLNTKTENLHERLMKITNGFGPDVMIEAVGSTITSTQALDEVCFSGRVVNIGYAKDALTYETRKIITKELIIKGSRNAEMDDFNAVMTVLEKRSFDINELITKIVPFEEAGLALDQWSKDPNVITKLVVSLDK